MYNVYVFTIIALFIILIAAINYINLATAKSSLRAKEIGVRKVAGAVRSSLINQFLIESLVLGLAGGAAGILFGVAISMLLSKVFDWPALISPAAVIVSAIFSMAIGVFFGYYPARKAANLDPIEALRFE